MKLLASATLLVAITLSLGVSAAPDNAVDRTAQRVEGAEERFESAVQRVADKLEAALNREIEEARNKGKLDLLVALQEQQQLYDEEDLIPRHSAVLRESKSYYQVLDREGDKLVKIYERAISDYTKADNIEAAKEMQERIDWLRPLKTEATEFGGHYYKVVTDGNYTWQQARDKCIAMGGYLACANSEKENALFQRLKGQGRNLWLGFSNGYKDGKWRGEDGSVMKYTNWIPGEPNGGVVNEIPVVVMMNDGRWDDIRGSWLAVGAFICEWDYEITRRTVKQSSGSREDEIELLKISTLKHNERIIAERNQLQQAILKADEEVEIVDAKSEYTRTVTSIKQDYINELTVVLDKSVEGDKLEVASKIKTQILRVRNQIKQLSSKDSQPDVPEIDAGGEDVASPEPRPTDPDDGNTEDGLSDDNGDAPGFFGLPLE